MKLFGSALIFIFFATSIFAAEFFITPEELVNKISVGKTQIKEFKKLAEFGEQNNFRIWIFGGSAATFAHYIKDVQENNYLLKNGKTPKYPQDRFGFYFYDVFRSGQDCDIVIDGGEEEAQKLEAFINKNFELINEGKPVFEVRLLGSSRGESGPGQKDALLGNADYLNQHTDSHSTGLIELTQPLGNDSVVRDLFDWNNQKDPRFLRDVVENRLSYYYSNLHTTTSRYLQKINPPIISVLRYYTKLFQFGLQPRPEDEDNLQKIISEFNPEDPGFDESYVNKQINRNGIKMLKHAQDVERAISVISGNGLKEKLEKFKSFGQDRIEVWVDKEPLKSFPLASKKGKTAAELGIDYVTHRTKDYYAYESITMSPNGLPNVFVSRDGHEGEAAIHGWGFYTIKALANHNYSTGYLIKYKVDPRAVEGVDFIYLKEQEFVILRNRSALRTVAESFDMGIVDYFKLMASPDSDKLNQALIKKYENRSQKKMVNISDQETAQILDIVKRELNKRELDWSLLKKWFSMKVSLKYPKIVERLLRRGTWYLYLDWADNRMMLNDRLAHNIFAFDHWSEYEKTFSYLTTMIKRKQYNYSIVEVVLQKDYWANHPRALELIDMLLKYAPTSYVDRMHFYQMLLTHLCANPRWQKYSRVKDLIRNAVETYNYDWILAQSVLPNLLESDSTYGIELFDWIMERGRCDGQIVDFLYVNGVARINSRWREHLDTIVKRGNADSELIRNLFSKGHWAEDSTATEYVQQIILRDGVSEFEFELHILSNPLWKKNYRFKELCGDNEITYKNIKEGLAQESEKNRLIILSEEKKGFYQKTIERDDKGKRLRFLRAIQWDDFSEAEKLFVLDRASQINDFEEMAAYINIANNSTDIRWMNVLSNRIDEWKEIYVGWPVTLRIKANAVYNKLEKLRCDQAISPE